MIDVLSTHNYLNHIRGPFTSSLRASKTPSISQVTLLGDALKNVGLSHQFISLLPKP